MDPRTSYVMTHLMNEVATVGTGHRAKNLGRPAAGKTGTTNDCLDAWFMGFTPHVVTGVWVGFDTQKSIGPRSTGGAIALPIWLDIMKEAVKSYPETDFEPPKGVAFTFIDGHTGKPTNANRPNAIREAFVEGTQPTIGGYARTVTPTQPNTQSGTPTSTPRAAPANDVGTEDFFKEDIQ
jgi:penicillin-binding protein 1A